MKTIRSTAIFLLLHAVSVSALCARPSVQVYPSGPTVPENLLRIELRFSEPMRTPLRMEQVHLADSNGVEIKDAFLDLPLPSPDGKRLTILFDPSRVKTGVGANLVLGRALHAGESVTLTIDHPALEKPIRKTWLVTAFDAESPQPALWTFDPPRVGSRTPLVLHLEKPISSTAEDLIAIRRSDGQRISGNAHLENSETVWRFVPARPWRAASYAVVTHPDLEDAAGNRPCSPFEVSVTKEVRFGSGAVLPFELAK